LGVPAFALRGELLIGFLSPHTTGERLKARLATPAPPSSEMVLAEACALAATSPCPPELSQGPAEVDTLDTPWFGCLSIRTLGLPLFTLVVGLLDGFNPCAMWVLLFLLSLLVNLQDRGKMLLIGGTFVATSGATCICVCVCTFQTGSRRRNALCTSACAHAMSKKRRSRPPTSTKRPARSPRLRRPLTTRGRASASP
jgi:hypothetical protein